MVFRRRREGVVFRRRRTERERERGKVHVFRRKRGREGR